MSSTPPNQPVTPTPAPAVQGPDMKQIWMNLALSLLPLLALSGPQAAFGAAMLQLVEAEVEQWKEAQLQTGEMTPEEVAAFAADWEAMKASPEWQVRP